MLKVTIESDDTKQFKTTLALLLQDTLDGWGVKSEISVDTPNILYVNHMRALAQFSKEDPIIIEEVQDIIKPKSKWLSRLWSWTHLPCGH